MPKVYCIVVTYNARQWIEKCLDSLLGSSFSPHIICVDNASTDQTVEIIHDSYPSVELISSDINLGFGGGNNLGLQRAVTDKADHVILLNQDAWIEKDTIRKLVDIQSSQPEFGIISPLHLNYEGTGLEYYFSTIIGPEACPELLNDLIFDSLKHVYPIEFVHAACWLISGKCLHAVGGFDPIFRHYGEDNDYINRASAKGFASAIVPSVRVYHSGSNDTMERPRDLHNAMNFTYLHLKDIRHRFRGALLVHLKTSADKLSSALLYRRWSDLRLQWRLFSRSIFAMGKIRRSRKACKQTLSFLNET